MTILVFPMTRKSTFRMMNRPPEREMLMKAESNISKIFETKFYLILSLIR